ncbi:ATP-binding protein [Rathayibacter oskolensis]|uniref:AlbA family DNA-binding domain-containing protein n=1 Tax=Rathayibacter oskolensis TaxID=1891671 RepID=UPI00265E875D|nr:ATP-binding protein [Rathayibacter oskolensis]WKK70481.1 ATP-binding protein [Rathayibacter oskolensis]
MDADRLRSHATSSRPRSRSSWPSRTTWTGRGASPPPATKPLANSRRTSPRWLNASGGVIVIGVEEDRGRGTAKAINDIDISESQLQRLRSWAAAHLRPIVVPLDITPIPSTGDAGTGLIAITIPASTNAPHFVNSKDNTLRAPVRYGTQTRWLTEPELAHAYSNRFQTAASLSAQLEEGVAQAMHGLDRAKITWLAAVARPEAGAGMDLTPITGHDFREVIGDAANRAWQIGGQAESHLHWRHGDAQFQRLGFRRRIFEDRPDNDVASFGQSIRVELHDDGAIALCTAVSRGLLLDNRAYVSVLYVEAFARDLIGLIEARSAQTGYSGRYGVRVEMLAALELAPGLLAHGPDLSKFGHMRAHGVMAGSREVHAPIPITSSVQPSDDVARVASAKAIATDLLHQFNVGQLLTLPND